MGPKSGLSVIKKIPQGPKNLAVIFTIFPWLVTLVIGRKRGDISTSFNGQSLSSSLLQKGAFSDGLVAKKEKAFVYPYDFRESLATALQNMQLQSFWPFLLSGLCLTSLAFRLSWRYTKAWHLFVSPSRFFRLLVRRAWQRPLWWRPFFDQGLSVVRLYIRQYIQEGTLLCVGGHMIFPTFHPAKLLTEKKFFFFSSEM